jgi:hypothetical protein
MNRSGMGSHQSHNMVTDEWFTPPDIIQALKGPFDFDPCTCVDAPFVTARNILTKSEDGLKVPWHEQNVGRVWMNPPYGRDIHLWMEKMALHGQGTCLIFARTETKAFFPWVWSFASAVYFFRGRLSFYNKNGQKAKNNSGAPSVLVTYGEEDAIILERAYPKQLGNGEQYGQFLRLDRE